MIMDQGAHNWPWQRPQPLRPWEVNPYDPYTKPYDVYPVTSEPKQPVIDFDKINDFLGRKEKEARDQAIRAENERLAKVLSELLRKAAEYDKLNNEPHCPDAEKKAKLQKIADELGVKIIFPDEGTPESCETH